MLTSCFFNSQCSYKCVLSHRISIFLNITFYSLSSLIHYTFKSILWYCYCKIYSDHLKFMLPSLYYWHLQKRHPFSFWIKINFFCTFFNSLFQYWIAIFDWMGIHLWLLRGYSEACWGSYDEIERIGAYYLSCCFNIFEKWVKILIKSIDWG